MASEPSSPTSFSRARRWGIWLSVLLSVMAVIAIVAMTNYLAARHHLRFSLSSQAEVTLSPQTLNLLKTITNDVKVVVYFDKRNQLYSLIVPLLEEYRRVNKHIAFETVDYVYDPATAAKAKTAYGLTSVNDKDLVIFESNGRTNLVEASFLGDYATEPVANNTGEREFRKVLKNFKGEVFFNSKLLQVTSNKPFKAYFILDHGGPGPRLLSEENLGYTKFLELLSQNYVHSAPITNLLGTNTIPSDCNLLIILGPTKPFFPDELDKIRQYLNQGGRMFLLLDSFSIQRPLGLETILTEDWNVEVGTQIVRDFANSQQNAGIDLHVRKFNDKHPIGNSLSESVLQLYQPRSISKRLVAKEAADAPKVEELAFTSENAVLDKSVVSKGALPLMVAVEKGGIKGVYAERGVTRIIVVGDSIFLNNQYIQGGTDNKFFAASAINWLLDRTQLMQGIAPKQVTEYRILMSRSQFRKVEWLLLAGMPGVVLLMGGLVWLRRRH